MIKSFKCKQTEKLFNDQLCPKFNNVQRAARRKLEMLNAARRLEELRIPPGNRLEALGGTRQGTYSIRINDQLRVCFRWIKDSAYEVEIVDYH